MREVVVIGAGVAGIQAALDLANHGVTVHLVEKEPTIGGHMAQLDKTFPTNDCSMCILSPKMVEVQRHPNIRIHTLSEVKSVTGKPGHFTVTILAHPRYIDMDTCTGCGDCIQICPVEVYNRFDAGVGVRKAIYKPHPQVVPDRVVKDKEHCIECGLCYDACGPQAILHEDAEREVTVRAAAIIVTTGYEVFDAKKKPVFGYLKNPDVITSMELERMINASGPTGGQIRRLSNGKEPKSIVFIQCVGSRDMPLKRPWCSCVCCMQAMKNAMLIREKHPEIEVTIFYMDVRAYGKGYEEYYERAKSVGVKFLRGLPPEVQADGKGMRFVVENTETGEVQILRPELVILSVGIEPSPATAGLVENLGITLEDTGFIRSAHDALDTTGTVRPGIYIAGTAIAPKDIPDSVASGESAAMRAFVDTRKTAVRARSK